MVFVMAPARLSLFAFVALLAAVAVTGQVVPLPSLKEQASILQRQPLSFSHFILLDVPGNHVDLSCLHCSFTNERVNTVLPRLMRQYGVDLWLLSMREYGEDNVFWAVKSATQFASRRRTVIVFYDDGSQIRRHDLVDNTDQVWANLNDLLEVFLSFQILSFEFWNFSQVFFFLF